MSCRYCSWRNPVRYQGFPTLAALEAHVADEHPVDERATITAEVAAWQVRRRRL